MSVPQVQDELVALLTPALAPVEVRFGRPLKLPDAFEIVYVIDEQNYRLGGGEQFRDETFSAQIRVEVFQAGDEPKATSDRRWVLKDEIDAALYAADFHGYATDGSVLAVASTLEGYANGWHAVSTLSITVEDHV